MVQWENTTEKRTAGLVSARSAGLAPFHRTSSASYSGLVLLPVSQGIKALEQLGAPLFLCHIHTSHISKSSLLCFIHEFYIVPALPSAAEYYQVLRCAVFSHLDPPAWSECHHLPLQYLFTPSIGG
jgi:hypothetical protein